MNTLNIATLFNANVFRCMDSNRLYRLADDESVITRWANFEGQWVKNFYPVDPDLVRPLYEIKIDLPLGHLNIVENVQHEIADVFKLDISKFTIDFREEIVLNNELFAVVGIRFKDKAIIRDGEFLMYRGEVEELATPSVNP